MTRQTETMTREAADALATTPTTELLTKAYALTHRVHAADLRMAGYSLRSDSWWRSHDEGRDLRAARDLITAEVLRRTGETR